MNTETFQQTFAASITSLIAQAYASGVLQYHPMVIMDITVTMQIFSHFNQLTVQYNGHLLSISMYDEDSESAQYSSIQNLVADIVTK